MIVPIGIQIRWKNDSTIPAMRAHGRRRNSPMPMITAGSESASARVTSALRRTASSTASTGSRSTTSAAARAAPAAALIALTGCRRWWRIGAQVPRHAVKPRALRERLILISVHAAHLLAGVVADRQHQFRIGGQILAQVVRQDGAER